MLIIFEKILTKLKIAKVTIQTRQTQFSKYWNWLHG